MTMSKIPVNYMFLIFMLLLISSLFKMTFQDDNKSEIYSSFILHPLDLTKEDYGSYWGEFEDVGITYNKNENFPTLCLFIKDKTMVKQMKDLFFTYKLYPLALSYHIETNPINKYNKVSYNLKGNTWIVPLAVPHQVFHFIDNYILLWNAQFDKNIPKVDNLININYEKSYEYEYSYFTYQLITKPLRPFKTELFRFDVMKKMRKYKTNLMYFKNVYIAFKSFYCKFGVIFPSNERRKMFRDNGYDLLNIYNNNNNNKLEICIIERKQDLKSRSRSLLNINEFVSFIKSLNYDVKIISFEDIPVNKQIQSIMNTKILISVMGSSLTNLFWMNNNVFLIQLFNYFYIHSDFTRISILNNYGYISLFSSDRCNEEEDHYKFIDKGCSSIPVTFSNTYAHFLQCSAIKTIFDDLKIRIRQFQYAFRYSLQYMFNLIN